jgi:pSer/pThr/pTyr-binding forkhead associated (FHA) protein
MEKELIGTVSIESGPQAGESLELLPDSKITIGRAGENDICIQEETVSRRHGELAANEKDACFRNYGRNGTIIDNRVIHEDEAIALRNNTLIEIGTVKMRIRMVRTDDTQIIEKTIVLATNSENGSRTERFPTVEKKNGKESLAAFYNSIKSEWNNLSGKYLRTAVSKVCFGFALLIPLLFLLSLSDNSEPEANASIRKQSPFIADLDSSDSPDSTASNFANDLKQVGSLFKTAEKLFAEKNLRLQNLHDSIQNWQEGIAIIELFADKPEKYASEYNAAVKNLSEAQAVLQKQYEDLRNNVIISYKKQEYQAAYDFVQRITGLIPDREDERYKWARRAKLRIEKKLQSNS